MKTKYILLGILFVFTIKVSSQTEVPIENRRVTEDSNGKYFKDITPPDFDTELEKLFIKFIKTHETDMGIGIYKGTEQNGNYIWNNL